MIFKVQYSILSTSLMYPLKLQFQIQHELWLSQYTQGSGVPSGIHLKLNQDYFCLPNQSILESALAERKIKASCLMLIGGIIQVFPTLCWQRLQSRVGERCGVHWLITVFTSESLSLMANNPLHSQVPCPGSLGYTRTITSKQTRKSSYLSKFV